MSYLLGMAVTFLLARHVGLLAFLYDDIMDEPFMSRGWWAYFLFAAVLFIGLAWWPLTLTGILACYGWRYIGRPALAFCAKKTGHLDIAGFLFRLRR